MERIKDDPVSSSYLAGRRDGDATAVVDELFQPESTPRSSIRSCEPGPTELHGGHLLHLKDGVFLESLTGIGSGVSNFLQEATYDLVRTLLLKAALDTLRNRSMERIFPPPPRRPLLSRSSWFQV